MSARPPAIGRASSLPQGTFAIKTRATAEGGSKKGHSYNPLHDFVVIDSTTGRSLAKEILQFTSRNGEAVLIRVFVMR